MIIIEFTKIEVFCIKITLGILFLTIFLVTALDGAKIYSKLNLREIFKIVFFYVL